MDGWYNGVYAKNSGVGIAKVYTDNPDFSIAVTPTDATVVQGGTTSYTVSVTPSNGFRGIVSLNAGGFGTGASGSFNPLQSTCGTNAKSPFRFRRALRLNRYLEEVPSLRA